MATNGLKEIARPQDIQLVLDRIKKHFPKSAMAYYMARYCLSQKGRTLFVNNWPQFSVVMCAPATDVEDVLKEDQATSPFLMAFAIYHTDNPEDVYEMLLGNKDRIGYIFQTSRPLNILVDPSLMSLVSKFCESYGHFVTDPTHRDICCGKNPVTTLRLLSTTADTLQNKYTLPDGFTLTSLVPDQADMVLSKWLYPILCPTPGYIKRIITTQPSTCLLNPDGKCVGFMIEYDIIGEMGLLYVFPEYRGKGYAQHILHDLAKKVLNSGDMPYCISEVDNVASIEVHRKCGFKVDDEIMSAFLKRN